MGSAAYAPEHDALVWKIKSFPGNKVGFDQSFYPYCYKVLGTVVYLFRMNVSCAFNPLFVCQLNCVGVHVESRIWAS